MQPPVPYADFSVNFPGADLPIAFTSPTFPLQDFETSILSSAEHNSFFGFLDNIEWDFDPNLPHDIPLYSQTPGSDTATQLASSSTSLDSGSTIGSANSPPTHPYDTPNRFPSPTKPASECPQYPSPQPAPRSSGSSSSSPPPYSSPPHHNHTTRTKPLLSTPQKRLNHIMSEQKRRNAIRDGYATLTNMLAPAGAPIGSGIPTRGRPKGSGSRGKKGTSGAKGKSGVLFRAVEYCKWLEEGCDALRREVERIELAAGVARPLS